MKTSFLLSFILVFTLVFTFFNCSETPCKKFKSSYTLSIKSEKEIPTIWLKDKFSSIYTYPVKSVNYDSKSKTSTFNIVAFSKPTKSENTSNIAGYGRKSELKKDQLFELSIYVDTSELNKEFNNDFLLVGEINETISDSFDDCQCNGKDEFQNFEVNY